MDIWDLSTTYSSQVLSVSLSISLSAPIFRAPNPYHWKEMMCNRPAETDAELRASATLRAESFYTYPPDRSFAGKVQCHSPCASTSSKIISSGNLSTVQQCFTVPLICQIHQIMKGDEEFEALKEQRDLREAGQPNQKSACLVAVCPAESIRVE